MLFVDPDIRIQDLRLSLERLWQRAGERILGIAQSPELGTATPVFTINGKYQPQGWTEWTQGFQFGAALLHFDATGDKTFLELGRTNTLTRMASHVTHFGVHDHGFNNVSTFGNLRRLALANRADAADIPVCEMALMASAAVRCAVNCSRLTSDPGVPSCSSAIAATTPAYSS